MPNLKPKKEIEKSLAMNREDIPEFLANIISVNLAITLILLEEASEEVRGRIYSQLSMEDRRLLFKD